MVNFIKNFWQGKKPLVKSFWLFYFLLFIFTSILQDFIFNLLGVIYQVKTEDVLIVLLDKNLYLFLFVMTYVLLDLAIYIWALVGTWRSASNYKKIKKNKIPWGTLTKIFLVLHIGVYLLWDIWVHLFNE